MPLGKCHKLITKRSEICNTVCGFSEVQDMNQQKEKRTNKVKEDFGDKKKVQFKNHYDTD